MLDRVCTADARSLAPQDLWHMASRLQKQIDTILVGRTGSIQRRDPLAMRINPTRSKNRGIRSLRTLERHHPKKTYPSFRSADCITVRMEVVKSGSSHHNIASERYKWHAYT